LGTVKNGKIAPFKPLRLGFTADMKKFTYWFVVATYCSKKIFKSMYDDYVSCYKPRNGRMSEVVVENKHLCLPASFNSGE